MAFTYTYVRARAYAGVNNQSERAQIHLHTYLYEKPRITTGLILRYYDMIEKNFSTAKVQQFFELTKFFAKKFAYFEIL